jgi:hypothetical protein
MKGMLQQPPGLLDVPVSPVGGHGNRLVVAVEAAAGDVTAGMVGSNALGPTAPTAGETLIMGTAAAELTPRLLISVDPNGSPVRATPPGVVGDVDVGVEDEAMLLDPEPHIPDNPEVSSIPDVVDSPDVADIPDDDIADEVDIPEFAMVPDVAAVAVPIVIPPPS